MFPINENSAASEEITFNGSVKPSKTASPRHDNKNNGKYSFVSVSLINLFFSFSENLRKNGNAHTKSAAKFNNIFFENFASGLKIQKINDKESENTEIRMWRIFPGFLHDFTMFFSNENKLLKIQ